MFNTIVSFAYLLCICLYLANKVLLLLLLLLLKLAKIHCFSSRSRPIRSYGKYSSNSVTIVCMWLNYRDGFDFYHALTLCHFDTVLDWCSLYRKTHVQCRCILYRIDKLLINSCPCSVSSSSSVARSNSIFVQHLLQLTSEDFVAWSIDERIHRKCDEGQWTG